VSRRVYLFGAILAYIILTILLSHGILTSIHVVAQYGTVRGALSDAGGKPITEAKVEVLNNEFRSLGNGRISDSHGHWHIDLPPGLYHFRVQKNGYRTAIVKNVRVKARGTVRCKANLFPSENEAQSKAERRKSRWAHC